MPKSSRGFTIVELLIVVIVIAILATITIIGFTGIQNRAKTSAAQSQASQAYKKLLAHAVDNSDAYPETLAQLGLVDGNGTTYQYRVDNSASPRTFCLTATTNGTSSFTSQASASPRPGSCPGHGNGVAPITNLIVNPTGASLSNFNGAGAPGNSVVMTGAGAHQGSEYIRRTFIGTGTAGIYRNNLTVNGGENYWASAWVRASKAVTITARIEWYAGSTAAGPTSSGESMSVSGSWTRLSVGDRAPTGATRATITFYATGSPWANNDYQDIDSLMFTQTPDLQSYADGYSDNWVWNGEPNNSTSTGSPL